MRQFLAACLIFAAPPALADCPTAADMAAGGVYIDFSDGTYVHYRQIETDVVGEATVTPDGQENFFSGRYRGVYLIIDAGLNGDRPDPDGLITFQPAEGDADWPAIAPGMRWSGTVVTRAADGDFINRFAMSVAVTGEDAIHISGCDYDVDVIRIEETYEDGDAASELRHIRALGIGYVAAAGPVGDAFEHHYTPGWIGLAPPR